MILVTVFAKKDLARDTDGDGQRYRKNDQDQKKKPFYCRDHVDDIDDDNDGILDVDDIDDDGDGIMDVEVFTSGFEIIEAFQ